MRHKEPKVKPPSNNYPANWDTIRRNILEKHLHQCVNCRRIASQMEIHHIVPVEYAGSHIPTNLVPLCRKCHKAAHEMKMAPRIQWYTNGELTEAEFQQHKLLWKQLRNKFGVPRYDSDNDCVYVPLADVERVIDKMYQ